MVPNIPSTKPTTIPAKTAYWRGQSRVSPIPEYKGSIDTQDLLDLYVGNTEYRKINRYLRSPDEHSGLAQIVDETINPTNAGSISKPKLTQAEYIKQASGNLNVGSSVAKGLQEQAKEVAASIPYIHQAVLDQPNYGKGAENYADVIDDYKNYLADSKTPSLIKSWDHYKNKLSYKQENYPNDPALKTLVDKAGSLANKADLDGTGNYLSNDELLEMIEPYYKSANTPLLQRGLHFKSPEEYRAFVGQHSPGEIVQYPAFTSTTSNQDIMEGFATNRTGQIPVQMEFRPNPNTGTYNARDVRNPAEAEYLYPPNSRFKVVGMEPLQNGGILGSKIIVQETDAPPHKLARMQALLDRVNGKQGDYFTRRPEPNVWVTNNDGASYSW